MKNLFPNIFLFLFIIKDISLQIIVIPFKKIIPSYINEKNFYSEYSKNIIYSNLKIGTPSKEIKAQIKMLQYSLCIRNNSAYGYKSSTSYQKNGDKISIYNIDYYDSVPSNETFIIGKENKVINEINFMLTERSKFDLDGILGLRIHENDYRTYGHGLINQLKSKRLINKEAFFFNYDKDKDEGELIIGNYPHFLEEFKNSYSEEQFKTTGIYIPNLDVYYDIHIRSIFWEEKEIETMIIAKIQIEEEFIKGTKLFDDACYKFFEPHIKKNKCERKKIDEEFNSYVCDDYPELNISTFPEIKFFNSQNDLNITLTYENLFIKKNNKIYFMVIFHKEGNNQVWTLGNIFIRSCMMVFDMDKRIIGFYDKKTENKENIDNDKKTKYIIYIIIISVAGFIILCLIGFIIYKFVYKKRSKKAVELIDDFETKASIGINE